MTASQPNSTRFSGKTCTITITITISTIKRTKLCICEGPFIYHSKPRGLITLIPKKNKPANFLKNWRPIILLNCDYKIAAKSIASRIRKVLPKIINNDQTGFLKNRFIGENIRLLDSIINYTNTEQIPGLLLFVDFEKAFGSVEWSFMEKPLKYYNFGASLVEWITLFYTDISSCIQNKGWSSDLSFLALSRGVRQGCPLSPFCLFYVQKYWVAQ